MGITDSLPPAHTRFLVLKVGVIHVGVWSLQESLNRLLIAGLKQDGSFGPLTQAAVKSWQRKRALTVDGIAGYATQRDLFVAQAISAYKTHPIPPGSLESASAGEASFELAALNDSEPGGEDAGPLQRRVYGPPWLRIDIERALTVSHQIALLAARLVDLHEIFMGHAAVYSSERAWRLAIYAHNNPAGADRLSRTAEKDLSAWWTTPAPPGRWPATLNAHFADGTPVQTPLEQAKFYALGAPEHSHEGIACRLVTSWP